MSRRREEQDPRGRSREADAPGAPAGGSGPGPASYRVAALPLGLALLLGGLATLPRISGDPRLAGSVWAAAAVLLVWLLVLFVGAARRGRRLQIQVFFRSTHWVQALIQVVIFLYWGWYWSRVFDEIWLLVAQILFAYGFDMLLAWSRRDRWRLGFGPLPIVLSTNLFLWFRDEWFFLQFLMLAVGFLGKELILWDKDGRRAHIFNPSAFSLFVFSLALLATGRTDMTWGEEIATTLSNPPHIYLLIFLLGLVVQWLFSVTLVTLTSVAALVVLNLLYTMTTGVYYFLDSGIPIAVFLGLHLLITDPSTSPRTEPGRVLFGALYGAGVFALYGALGAIGVPTFYDKLLCVPLLNLTVQHLDGIARRPAAAWIDLRRLVPSLTPRQRNAGYMALWGLLFAGLISAGFVGRGHQGRDPDFWRQACEDGLRNGCERWVFLQRDQCRGGAAPACDEVGTILDTGLLVPRDSLEAGKSFARACDLEFGPGCGHLEEWMAGDGSELAADACDAGDGVSCFILGAAYQQGLGLAPDDARSLARFQRSCELGWARGCGRLGEAYLWGEGVQEDHVRAAQTFETACDGGHGPSCSNLGLMLRRGMGMAMDETRAREFLQRACDLGTSKACAWVEEAESTRSEP